MSTLATMDASQIQAEFQRLAQAKPNDTQMKTSLFNLIVYTHNKERTIYFKTIVDSILKQFPCRLIFIEARAKEKEAKIHVEVISSNTKDHLTGSDKIHIQASGSELTRVPFLILPHLISDLPIYLLWGQDPNKDELILPLIRPLATRIIFDSVCSDHLPQFSQKILHLMQSTPQEILDMNWTRISGWRQIIARAFDTKIRIKLLTKTSYMRLVYNSLDSNSEAQAIYLQAWIASCLNWKFLRLEKNEKNQIIYYQGETQQIQINLEKNKREDLAPGEIIEWELCDPENYDCVFQRNDMTHVTVKASNHYQCLLPFKFLLPTLHSGRSLMQEIFYQRISEHYPSVLKLISQIK